MARFLAALDLLEGALRKFLPISLDHMRAVFSLTEVFGFALLLRVEERRTER